MRFTKTYAFTDEHGETRETVLTTPEFPPALSRSMAIMDSAEYVEPAEVAAMIEGERAVSHALLQTVNSAYYGLHRPVEQVERAVILLGPLTVTGTAMAMELLQLQQHFEGTARRAFIALIRHSAATAFVARHIVNDILRRGKTNEDLAYQHVGEAFAAGMLHDFGKLILLYNQPDVADGLYKPQAGTDESARGIGDLERIHFGCDHVQVGADFATGMKYPDLVTRVIRCHLYPEEHVYDEYAQAVLIRATSAADVLVATLGIGFPYALPPEVCSGHDVWRQLAEFDYAGTAPDDLIADARGLEDHIHEFLTIVSSV